MNTITVSTGVPIQLGYQYDDYATEVVFPSAIISQFTTTYGSGGTFAIWYRRSGDATGYPIGNPLVVFDSSASTVTWTVVETDLANPGQAQVQLRYIKDEHCVMSQMFTAIVEDSVDIGTEIPEPMEEWADAIIKAGSGGQPTAVTSSSSMTNHSAIYLYMGNESGYQYGHIYYWDGTYWADGGAYGGGSSGSGLTEDVKQALLDCFANVAWIGDDGQDYVDALEAALYPPAELQSITAVYTQSSTVYDTDTLDSLKADLVVTANYDNGTIETVTSYVLSGTLVEGTSVITVTYGGKTTTFNVTVINIFDTPLPEGYTRYDYVYNDSVAAYLNTELGTKYVNTSYEIGVRFSVPNLTANANSSAVYCIRQNTGAVNSRAVWVQGVADADNVAFHLANTDTGFIHQISGATIYEIVTVDKKAYVDDTLVITVNGDEGTPTKGTIPLFGRCDNGVFYRGTTVFRIYAFWVKGLTGEYDAVMLPCTNGNGVAGFYDVVREQFYDGTPYASHLHAGND